MDRLCNKDFQKLEIHWPKNRHHKKAPCHLTRLILFRFFPSRRGVTKGKLLRRTQIHNMLKCQLVISAPKSTFSPRTHGGHVCKHWYKITSLTPEHVMKMSVDLGVLGRIGHEEDRSSYSRITTNSTHIFTIILCGKL